MVQIFVEYGGDFGWGNWRKCAKILTLQIFLPRRSFEGGWFEPTASTIDFYIGDLFVCFVADLVPKRIAVAVSWKWWR